MTSHGMAELVACLVRAEEPLDADALADVPAEAPPPTAMAPEPFIVRGGVGAMAVSPPCGTLRP